MRHRPRSGENINYIAFMFAESRNRMIVTAALVMVAILMVLVAIFLIPETPALYLYQGSDSQSRMMEKMISEFRMGNPTGLQLWLSNPQDRLDFMARGDAAPLILAYPGGRGAAGLELALGDHEASLRSRLTRSSFPRGDTQQEDRAVLLAMDPVGLVWRPPSREPVSGIFRSLSLFFQEAADLDLLPLRVAGGDDRELLDFISVLILSFIGLDEYDQLARDLGRQGDFNGWLEADNPPGSPGEATLRQALALVLDWTIQGFLPLDWYTLGSRENLQALDRGEKGTWVLHASEVLKRLPFSTVSPSPRHEGGGNELDRLVQTGALRFSWFPPSGAVGGNFICGWGLYLGRSQGKSRYNRPEPLQAADRFMSWCTGPEARDLIVTLGHMVPTEALPGGSNSDLFSLPQRLASDMPVRFGLWNDGFNRMDLAYNAYGPACTQLCQKIRGYLEKGLAPYQASGTPGPAASSE